MYEKRLCVLKQIKKGFSADGSALTGAVYAERLGGELIITPRIPALAPLKEGRYAIAIAAGGRNFLLELKGNDPLRVPADFSIREGFSALICFVRGEAEPIAFGACGGASADFSLLLNLFERGEKEALKKIEKEDPKRVEQTQGEREIAEENDNAEYNDEAIADSNYFGSVWKDPENADSACKDTDKAGKKDAGDPSCADETDASMHPFESTRGTLTYYNEIQPKLKEAMTKYPRDEHMQQVFPNSEWVKAENGLLGVVYEKGVPRFLCVAMKTEPPEQVRDASIFVPDSPYSDEEGYYVVFQDADTGEYVTIEES